MHYRKTTFDGHIGFVQIRQTSPAYILLHFLLCFYHTFPTAAARKYVQLQFSDHYHILPGHERSQCLVPDHVIDRVGQLALLYFST